MSSFDLPRFDDVVTQVLAGIELHFQQCRNSGCFTVIRAASVEIERLV